MKKQLPRIIGYGLLTAVVLLVVGMRFVGWPGSNRPSVDAATAEGVWLHDPDTAFALAAEQGKPVLIDFYADWCPPCKLMDKTTLRDAEVVQRLETVVPLKIDVDQHPRFVQRYGIYGIPDTVLADPTGLVVRRQAGYLGPEDYLDLLPVPVIAPQNTTAPGKAAAPEGAAGPESSNLESEAGEATSALPASESLISAGD